MYILNSWFLQNSNKSLESIFDLILRLRKMCDALKLWMFGQILPSILQRIPKFILALNAVGELFVTPLCILPLNCSHKKQFLKSHYIELKSRILCYLLTLLLIWVYNGAWNFKERTLHQARQGWPEILTHKLSFDH